MNLPSLHKQSNSVKIPRHCWYLLLLLSVSVACKKTDETDPVIVLIQPSSTLTIHNGDTVYVEAEITDNTNLETVAVQVVDMNLFPVTASELFHPGVTSYHLAVNLISTDWQLASGSYLISIVANDGTNSSYAYRQINYIKPPANRKSILLLSQPALNSVLISKIDSATHALQTFQSLSGDYTGSGISSYYQRIYSCGSITGDFSIIDANDGTLLNFIPSNSTPLIPTFLYYYFKDELSFISFYDGNIKAFDFEGHQKFTADQLGYAKPGTILKTGGYLLAENFYTSVSQNRLSVYYFPTGATRQECVIDMDIVCMEEKSADEIMLFGMQNNHTLIEKYQFTSNGAQLIRDLGIMTIYDVFQFNSNEYYFATSNGWYYYTYDQNSLSQINSLPVYKIEYDDLNNEFFLLENLQVRVIDGTNFSEKYVISSPDSVLDLQILYSY